MTTAQVDHYNDLSESYLRHAWELFVDGDLPQASEKTWGAAAVAMKACAESRGLEHGGHRHLFRVARVLAEETNDPDLRRQFETAGQLHTNYYEDNRDAEDIEFMMGDVDSLIAKLRQLA